MESLDCGAEFLPRGREGYEFLVGAGLKPALTSKPSRPESILSEVDGRLRGDEKLSPGDYFTPMSGGK
jgi:hypothetical protein